MAKSNGKLVALLNGVVVGERRSPRDYVVAIVTTHDAAQVAHDRAHDLAQLAAAQAKLAKVRAKVTPEQVEAFVGIRASYDAMMVLVEAERERGEYTPGLFDRALSSRLIDHPGHELELAVESVDYAQRIVDKGMAIEPTGKHTVLRWSQTMRAAQAAFGSFSDRYTTLTLCPVERR